MLISSIGPLPSSENNCLLILVYPGPMGAVDSQQTSKRYIRLYQHCLNTVTIEKFGPAWLSVICVEKTHQYLIAVNISTTIHVNLIIRMQSPNDVAAPVVVVENLRRQLLRLNEVCRRGGKLFDLCFCLLSRRSVNS